MISQRFVISPQLLLLACLALGWLSAGPATATMLKNGGMEAPFSEAGIAESWIDDSQWSKPVVTFSRATDAPHEGSACQRIAMEKGTIQFGQRVAYTQGAHYRVSLWLRGTAKKVKVQARKVAHPYTTYAELEVTPTAAWQHVTYLFTSTVTDPDAWLILQFDEPGTLDIDDVSLTELSQETIAQYAHTPRYGNFVRNGTFDLGLANWVSGVCNMDILPVRISVEKVQGNPCLRWDVPERRVTQVFSEAFTVPQGNPYIMTCRAKADHPLTLTMRTQSGSVDQPIGTEWTTVELRGFAPFSPNPEEKDFVNLVVTDTGTIWIDDVVYRLPDAPYANDQAEAALISDRHPLSYYNDGDTLRLSLYSRVPLRSRPVPVRWRITNYWGKVVRQGTRYARPGVSVLPIRGHDLPRGFYHATVTWPTANGEERNEATFCLLPPAERTGPIDQCMFGTHSSLETTSLDLGRRVGSRWQRLNFSIVSKWYYVEPSEGQWQWWDQGIRQTRDAGYGIMGSLHLSPLWATSAPEGTPDYVCFGAPAWMPKDLAKWQQYVRTIVTHYRDDITLWEVWNEVDRYEWLSHDETQTQAQAYLTLLKATYSTIKEANPKAVVIGAAVTALSDDTWPFIEELIKIGGLEYMDVFSFHDYREDERSGDELPVSKTAWVERLRQTMREAGREIPITHSEGGFVFPGTSISLRPVRTVKQPAVSPTRMAAVTVRDTVSLLGHGVQQVYYYHITRDGVPAAHTWNSFVEGGGQPRPNVASYAVMTWLLDGATPLRYETPTADSWVYYFTTPRGVMAVAWSRTGTTVQQAFPGASQAWDLMGVPMPCPKDGRFTLTEAPIYILLPK